MGEVPLHRFISFQVWALITFAGIISSVLTSGLDTGITVAPYVSIFGGIIGIAANELTEGSVTKGV